MISTVLVLHLHSGHMEQAAPADLPDKRFLYSMPNLIPEVLYDCGMENPLHPCPDAVSMAHKNHFYKFYF